MTNLMDFFTIWEEVDRVGAPHMLDKRTAGYMHELIVRETPSLCVEIGTHLGRSATLIARTIEEWGGKLHCYDPYLTGHQAFMDRPGDDMYAEAAKNLAPVMGTGVLTLHRARSQESAVRHENESVDFIYLDGDHELPGVFDDIQEWLPKLRLGGIIIFDNIEHGPVAAAADRWTFAGVYEIPGQRAVRKTAKSGLKE